jgi:hypothetical protein
MFNILRHEGNANQNNIEMPCYPRMTIIKKTNNKCWRGEWKKGALIYCWWGSKLVQSLWKSVCRFLKKLKWSCYTTSRYMPEGIKISTEIHATMFNVILLTVDKSWNHPSCPSTDEWKKENAMDSQWSII